MPDIAIIGDGVIGLSTAYELGQAGATVHVLGAMRDGVASEAAAGLLAPSIGELPDDIRPFFADSLARYPRFVERLREYDPELAIVAELIEPSTHDEHVRRANPDTRWLTTVEATAIEPAVLAPHGAMLHTKDGAVDNVRLVRALRRAVEASPGLTHSTDDAVVGVELSGPRTIAVTRSGARIEADVIVLAAGAWASQIAGLPRRLPVTPLKGQMLAVRSTALRHAVVGPDVYLVPRVGEIVIGATTELAGFDTQVSPDSIDRLQRAAIAICPPLAGAAVLRTWAGIRPATPDLLPILGTEPAAPRLVYACGHSKNGILLAPGTAVAIASLALGRPPATNLAPFSVDRFGEGLGTGIA